MTKARPIELAAWKHTVCPTCRLMSACPFSVDNLRLCHAEQFEGLNEGSLELLLKRTVHKYTYWKVKPASKPISNGIVWKVASSGPPANLAAALYCSDKEEYLRCLHSTS